MPQLAAAPGGRGDVRRQGDRPQPHRRRRRAGAPPRLSATPPITPQKTPHGTPHVSPHGTPQISVIIPTLNEAGWLTAAVVSAGAGAAEIVVSDSGSTDATPDLARRLAGAGWALKFLPAPAGGLPHRAAACNRGAEAARGDVLLFLDADCRLPTGWAAGVRRALADPGVVGGGFHLHLDGPEPALRRVEWINRQRYRRSHLFFGDQGVFVRTAAFDAAGGFPEIPVLESARLCKALKRHGRLALLAGSVSASPRRFRDGGIGRVFRADFRIWLRGLLRLGPGPAGRDYWQENRSRG